MKNNKYKYGNRCSYNIYYHIILVCKYRKPLLRFGQVNQDIIRLSKEILQKHGIRIIITKSDKDHIHYLIESLPKFSITWIISLLKSYTTYHIWRLYPKFLKRYYYKRNIFWTSGYFSSTIGNISVFNVYSYIENQ